ncbi:50S rRNA methyltransferase [Pontibacillus halophilus JSM 076056 = DSM 19796]|uniref:Ribosomal RNA large subunit methyltransferase H n=1 Tax=Pontibacillus halophilus JSM 076056 = DSM 19796 TaxID=1385510 RepID=A0A0A5GK94_9BACI|nr:23S rRNA (pseudouridine(1915)-N(3))-methyltransferase RlmH [Pontibacillus halophilus]KGX93706.1 50S rRNA methyltransferase [Pontibacillus halophilus JSM 076056 = DSM 19796]
MQIQIVSVGKIKEKYIKQGITEFEKRLRPYCKLTMDEVNDEQAPEQMSEKEMIKVKDKEGERILNKIKPNQYVIVLDLQGEQWSSENLAKHMEQLSIHGKSQVSFVIGGSNGLSNDVLKRADQKLSFSKMTFPHQLMKLILMEQIYRAFKIQKNEPYHK